MPEPVVQGQAIMALGLLVAAAISDLRRRVIPNWVALGLLALFLLPNLYWAQAIGQAVAVAAGMFVLGAMLFHLGLVGGGDVKLMAAVTLWCGTGGLVQFAVLTSLAGGVLSLLCLGWETLRRRAGRPGVPFARLNVPYGVAIALGGVPFVAMH